MGESYSFLDENPFVKQQQAEAKEKRRQEGFSVGLQEGFQQGLQSAIVVVVEVCFPDLKELAQQKATRITKLDTLTIILRGVIAAPDEKTARFVLDKLAA
jgi:flagellar biosynthesis/type III secretory pathway protein FliH